MSGRTALGGGMLQPDGMIGTHSTMDTLRAARLVARLEHIPFTPWHMRARVVMGSATFLDAFDALSLAFVLPILIGMWHITSVQIGWLIAASYIGQFVGALIFSRLAETAGRIPAVIAATALMSVMSFGCIFSGSFEMLFICRLIQGIGVGGEMPVAATYISEMSKARGRGRFFMLYEMIFPVGLMMTGQIATLLVPVYGWKTLFMVGGIPGMLVAIAIFWLPESPRWLISRGRLDEAETVITRIEASAKAKYPDFVPGEGSALHAGTAEHQTIAFPPAEHIRATERGRWAELLSPVFRNRTLIAWVLWAAAFFVANSLNNWMPTLCQTIYHMNLKEALRVASMTNVAQVAILLVCAFCIDRIGRRSWTIACFIIGMLIMGGLAFGTANVYVEVSLAIIAYGVIGSINAVLYLYTPEIYPTRMRAIGVGLSTSWLRVASAVGPAIVGYMVRSAGIHAVFTMFAVVALVGALASWKMIETQNRQLEEIAR